MRYRIRELSHVEGSDLYYVLVDFAVDGAVVLTNDFLMQVAASHTYTEGGRQRTVTVDVPAIIDRNIRAYWQRASARAERGNRTDPRIRRDSADPKGVLAREDVQLLVGVERE